MSDKKFYPLTNYAISNYIHELVREGGSIKNEIFKSVIMKKDLDKRKVQQYLGYVNSFLRYWDEYASSLYEEMKKSNGIEGVKTIPYERIRDFVYAKNDYASVLEFLDGMIKITKKEGTKVDDITDFMDHTLSKAFPDREDSVAGLLDNALDLCSYDSKIIVDKSSSSKYSTVKSYNIFDRRERSIIYKAVEKTIDYMVHDITNHSVELSKDMKMFVSIINNIVEYINYTLTAFATRIYVISSYASPFIIAAVENADGPKYEAAANIESNPDIVINVLSTTDEIVCRDFDKFSDFAEAIDTFIKAAGIDLGQTPEGSCCPRITFQHIGDSTMNANPFCSKLISNRLYQFLTKDLSWGLFDGNRQVGAEELNAEIRALIYNPTQGIQGTSSPKQEILQVIKNINPKEETLEGYKELFKDFSVFGLNILFKVKDLTERMIRLKSDNGDYPRFHVTAVNRISESMKIVAELYRDLATAILYRARDLEMIINTLRNAEIEKTFSSLKLNVLGSNKKDVSPDDNNMSGVPDTTRIPLELMDIYSSPTFEYLQMLDEYTKHEYGLEDDPYFAEGYYAEAVSVGDIVNKIMSVLAAARKRFDTFFNNKSFVAAYKWVQQHQNELTSMTFTGALKVLPYTKDINIDHIPSLIASINSFNEKDVASTDAMNEFIKKLYLVKGKSMQDLFNTEKFDEKTAGALYTNFVLFGKDPLVKENATIEPILLDSSEKIKQQLPNWIDNVSKAEQTHKSLLDTSKRIETAVNSLKSKVVSIQGTPSSSSTPSQKDEAPALNGGNDNTKPGSTASSSTTQSTSNTQQQKDDMGGGKQASLDKLLVEIASATNKMWDGLYYPITKAMKDQYQYIKEAYTIGRK